MTARPGSASSAATAPLIVSIPHAGTEPAEIEARFVSRLARPQGRRLVGRPASTISPATLDATIVRTALSRTVIDVNRDPSGASLYPGQATTELCPTTTFDGEPLYRAGQAPTRRRSPSGGGSISSPITPRSRAELARLRATHRRVVLVRRPLDPLARSRACSKASCRSSTSAPTTARAAIPRLTRGGRARSAPPAAPATSSTDGSRAAGSPAHFGRPQDGVHALQMELACRAYMPEPDEPSTTDNWPTPLDPTRADAAPMLRATSCRRSSLGLR